MNIYLPIDSAVTVPVNIYPLTDDTDGKTVEESVAYNATGMDLIWNFVTPAGVVSADAVTPTTGGDYDWAHNDGGMYEITIPADSGASINNDTAGWGYFSGVCDGVLPWRGPTIGFGVVPANFASLGIETDGDVHADVKQVRGSDIAALTDTDKLQVSVQHMADAISSDLKPMLMLTAEIATVTDQTHFTLASGSATDDAYNGQMIVLYDDSNSDFPCTRRVVDYTGATKTVEIEADPSFTLAADDSIKIFHGVNVKQINGSTLAAGVLGARNYSHYEDGVSLPEIDTTSTGRAANLRISVAAAQAMTPGGDALAVGNRAISLVPAGVYDFGTGDGSDHGLELDTQFADLVGLGDSRDDIVLTSQIEAASRGTVEQSASDVRIANLTMEIDSAYSRMYDNTDPAAYWPATDLSSALLRNTHCVTRGDNYASPTRYAVEYSGTYEDNKITGDEAFGGGEGTHSGKFRRNEIIGDYGLGAGCTGLFVANYIEGNDALGGASGSFIDNITIGNGARYGTSGVYVREFHIGDGGFGGTSTIALSGYDGASVSGVLLDCICTGTNPTMKLTSAVIAGCYLRYKDNYTGTTSPAIELQDSGSVVVGSTLHHTDAAAEIIASDGSARSVAAVGNRYNNVAAAAQGLGTDVTNVGCDGSNDFDPTDATALTTIADAILNRSAADTAAGSLDTLRGLVLARMNARVVAGGVEIANPDGSVLGTLTKTTAASADVVTGVALP